MCVSVAGVNRRHMACKGGGPLVLAMPGNQVGMAFIASSLILTYARSGSARSRRIRRGRQQPEDVLKLAQNESDRLENVIGDNGIRIRID